MAALSSWWIMVPVRSARPRWRWGVLWGLRDTHCSILWRWSPRGPSAAPPKTWTQWNWRWGRSDAHQRLQRRFSQRLCPCLRICSSVPLQQMIPHQWNPEVRITSTEESCSLRSSPSMETWWERRQQLCCLLLKATFVSSWRLCRASEAFCCRGRLLEACVMHLYQNGAIVLEAAVSSELAKDWNGDEISEEEIDHQ